MNCAFIYKQYLAIFCKCWAEKIRFVKVQAFDDDNENCLLKNKIFSRACFLLCCIKCTRLLFLNFFLTVGSGQGIGLCFESLKSTQVDNKSTHVSNRHTCWCVHQTLPTKEHHYWCAHQGLQNNIALLLLALCWALTQQQ